MNQTRYLTCPLCEAMCGLTVEVRDNQIKKIAGDAEDPLSRGYICPKAHALKDLHEDPQRLRTPVRRVGTRWVEVSWQEALDEAAEKIAGIQKQYGNDSIGFYTGNPNIHSYSAQLFEMEFAKCLGTRNLYSTASMDHLPHLLAAFHMFGSQALLPVPDIERTDYILILGANPVESNGSLMSAPGMPVRLMNLRKRGGKAVVIDPRRTRTAELADQHYFIQPGTDALLILAMLNVISEKNLINLGRLAQFTAGIDNVLHLVKDYPPERAAIHTGIASDAIRTLAEEFAGAQSAVCYGRLGSCTQEFGGLTCWLINVLNILTGNLDRSGGSMFTTPAVDLVRIASLLKSRGSFAALRSRVRELPEFTGFLPVAALAEEIETAGQGQIRALIVSAGNPVISTPNGARLKRVLPELDFFVAIDFYINETNNYADLILPPVTALERDHYDLVFRAFGARNTVRYTEPLFPPPAGARADWQIYAELGTRVSRYRDGVEGYFRRLAMRLMQLATPRRMLSLMLRAGPYGSGLKFWQSGISLKRLKAEKHTLDLGSLKPLLPGRLDTKKKRIELAPDIYLKDLCRLDRRYRFSAEKTFGSLVLIGRRQVKTNNSWMHRFRRLTGSRNICTLIIHPDDANTHGILDGQIVEVHSRTGTITVEAEISDKIMPGVVSLPHGFGHKGVELTVDSPERRQSASINDITDEYLLDELSGTVGFNGIPVEVMPVPTAILTAEGRVSAADT